MEMIEGGSMAGCVAAAAGIAGIAIGFALIGSGQIGWGTYALLQVGGLASGISTGLSIGDCIYGFTC